LVTKKFGDDYLSGGQAKQNDLDYRSLTCSCVDALVG